MSYNSFISIKRHLKLILTSQKLKALIQTEFNLSKDITYLNHAAVSPWPATTSNAIRQFATENNNYGATYYPKWNDVEENLRLNLATLINASSPDDIALVKNTSEALSMVAYGLNWQAGDNIVISDEEFPSNRIVWQSLANKQVTVKQISLKEQPEEALIAACNSQTKLLAISSTQYSSGITLDLVKLGNACKKKNILFCVDAIQTIGALQLDVQKIQADFVMADGHKWMLAPEGLALFYCNSKIRPKLKLNEFGWHMTQDMYNFNNQDWEIANSARRFECGSPNMLGIHGLNASITLLLEVGMDTIEKALLENSEYLFSLLNKNKKIEIITPQSKGQYAGIVTFKHFKKPTDELFSHLWANKIICAQRGDGVRFSAHFYTSKTAIKKAADLLVL